MTDARSVNRPATRWRQYVGPKRLVAVVAMALVLVWGRRMGSEFATEFQGFVGYTAVHPVATLLLFLAGYVVASVALIPTLPLNLLAGIIWGPWLGGLVATLCGSCGAALPFLAARSLFGAVLARRFPHAMVAQLQSEFAAKGWLFVGFMRINPVFPTALLNYVLGLTSISFASYFWATALFLLPPGILIAWIGNQGGSAVLAGSAADRWNAILIVSACATLLFVGRYLAKLVKPEYRS